MRIVELALATSTMLGVSIVYAMAAPAIGLVGDKTLVMFDTEDGKVTKTMDVADVEKLLGIDFRPANKTLIGVTEDHGIVAINIESGAVNEVSKMSEMLPITQGQAVIVDFNPMADRLRFMTGTTNHRVHPDTGAVTVDGKLAFEKGDAGEGSEDKIAAAAYTNSIGKPEKTAMFNIDAGNKTLVQQTKPNDGTLKTIGKLEISESPETYAFDIHGLAEGHNTAYLVGDNTIYTVDLETGAATKVGMIEKLDGHLRDIAILPAS
ncbi:hypothetical protein Brsp05_04336 [Brucella sp. NBRC 12953]|uniref:DUF4394 domain-containing protein n=1 Tax=Brucella sp. NBRC 12953 TaxID=3075481 RepID=UPI0030A2D8C6